MRKLLSVITLSALGFAVSAETLTWIGAEESPGLWNLDPENAVWKNGASENVPWSNGSTAVFPEGGPVSIKIGGGVSAAQIHTRSDLLISGDPLTISGLVIDPGVRDIRILSGLNAPDGLSVANALLQNSDGEYDGEKDGWMTTNETIVVFKNFPLKAVNGIKGVLDGNWAGGKAEAGGYFWAYDPETDTATVQFQRFDRWGNFVKGVKVLFAQQGEDIAGKMVWAKYVTAYDPGEIGIDLEQSGADIKVAENPRSDGYIVSKMSIIFPDGTQPVVRLEGRASIGQSIEIGKGAALCLTNNAVLNGNAVSNRIVNNGTFIQASNLAHTFWGAMEGSGKMVVDVPNDLNTNMCAFAGYVGDPDHETRFPDVNLCEIDSLAGEMGGMLSGLLPDYIARSHHLRQTDDPNVLVAQMQFVEIAIGGSKNSYLKCVGIRLEQVGKDVVATPRYSKYVQINNGSPKFGYDFDNFYAATNTVFTGQWPANGYGIHNFGIVTRSRWVVKSLQPCTYTGGTHIRRGKMEDRTPNAFNHTNGGVIEIDPEGELYMNVTNCWAESRPGGGGEDNLLWVKGLLTLDKEWLIGYSKWILVDGGEIDLRFSYYPGDSWQYIEHLTLRNGARLTGNAMRTGYASITPPYLCAVDGTTPCTNAAGIILVRRTDWNGESKYLYYHLEIEDVTDSPEPDYLISGPITDVGQNKDTSPGLTVVKKGPGTVLVTGTNTSTSDIQVVEGTIALGNSRALAGNRILLEGGSLELLAPDLRAGLLEVTGGDAAAAIDLGKAGEEGSISFADSSGIAWDGDLIVTGNLRPGRVRFGTGPRALTGDQVARIRCRHPAFEEPQKVILNPDGWLTLAPKATLLILR